MQKFKMMIVSSSAGYAYPDNVLEKYIILKECSPQGVNLSLRCDV
jgi:hypothetical protein